MSSWRNECGVSTAGIIEAAKISREMDVLVIIDQANATATYVECFPEVLAAFVSVAYEREYRCAGVARY